MWICAQIGKSEHNKFYTLNLQNFGIESKIKVKITYVHKPRYAIYRENKIIIFLQFWTLSASIDTAASFIQVYNFLWLSIVNEIHLRKFKYN
jgi:hypothetical protein